MSTAFLLIIVGALVAVTDLTVAAYFMRRYRRFKSLQHPDTGQATAIIEGLEKRQLKNSISYQVRFRFNDWKGNGILSSQSIPAASWEALQTGERIPVLYLRHHPTVCALADHVDVPLRQSKILMLCIAAAGMIALILCTAIAASGVL